MKISFAKLLIVFPMAIALVTAPVRGAEEKPLPRITGTYSDMRYVREAGDVIGTELKIVFTGSEFQGALQIAEGSPGPLLLVIVQQDGNAIRFTLPAESSYPGTFRGSISNGVLRGEFQFKTGGSQTVVLRRGKSYWD